MGGALKGYFCVEPNLSYVQQWMSLVFDGLDPPAHD